MTPADRAIVAAAEERDRAWLSESHWTAHDRHPEDDIRGLLKSRRELLRIVREQEAQVDGLRGWVRKQLATPWNEGGTSMTGTQAYDAALEEVESRL